MLILCLCVRQGRWESQQDIFMPSQFYRSLPRPSLTPSPPPPTPTTATSPTQDPEQGSNPPHRPLLLSTALLF